ncbi:transmembrane domain-containing protein TMIGD3-like isoform X3 [Salmo trutta]|uniref:transmembrane domain-containing protein TMIGD3-like isoform X2 n=1 Tax=Salmo trutta TaxID=8032 RepID=UPI0011306E4E|nr:transmembrane domain-containing protein TMIGD3-like isoform X2 [Salmo trutta]XP_029545791.1 transmembrane domain-containing protein TMIGD3-like isoform X3 [Salmo trutta]
MKILHIVSCCLLSALCVVESAVTNVEEVVGGQVTVGCSFTLAGNNNKYFCKGTCSGEDILVETNGSKNVTQDRYSIEDKGNVFYATIKDLRKSDSGTYWCGVDRTIKDTFQEVRLIVTDEKAVSGKSLTTATPTEAMTTDSAAGVLVYIGTGLGMVVCVLVLVLLIFIRQRNRTKITESANSKRTAFQPICSTTTNQNIDTACDITTSTISCPDDIYSNIGQSAEVPDTVSYATVNFPRDPACLHYDTVNFPRDPACLQYDNVNFTRDPACLHYAPVNFTRDPACLHYAPVNFPRDPACLHYDTVNFTRDPA